MRSARPLLIGTALLVGLALPAAAQDNGVAGGLFAELAGNEETARAVLLDWFGTVPPDHEALYVAYLQDMAADPAVVAYVVGQTGQPTDPSTYLAGPVQAEIQAAILGGVSRLGPEAQLAYYLFAVDTFDWVAENEPEGCVTLLAGAEPADGDDPALEFQNAYQATLSVDEITVILGMSRAGLTAEVTDAVPVNAFTDAELAAGITAYQTALNTALAATTNPDALVAAAADMATAPAGDVCTIGLLTLDTLTGLEPPERDWAIQALAGRM